MKNFPIYQQATLENIKIYFAADQLYIACIHLADILPSAHFIH